jgi:hypothetical protein
MDAEIARQLEAVQRDNAALRAEVATLAKAVAVTQRKHQKLSRRVGEAEDTALIPWDWINVLGIVACVGSIYLVDVITGFKLSNLIPFHSTPDAALPVVSSTIEVSTTSGTSSSPKTGDTIAGHEVPSPWGPRTAPCVGCSDFHRGVDVGAPIGSPVKALGQPGETVTVKCEPDDGMGKPYSIQTVPSMPDIQIEVLHLSKCNPGQYPAGTAHSSSGDAGTGPHYHIQIRKLSQQGNEYNGLFPPPKWAVEGVITGQLTLPGNTASTPPGGTASAPQLQPVSTPPTPQLPSNSNGRRNNLI